MIQASERMRQAGCKTTGMPGMRQRCRAKAGDGNNNKRQC
jgi:hypothetical protein